jgi:hypothetical protein
MEIKDKKLVGALVAIIVLLSAALIWLYTSTPRIGQMGDRPEMPQGMMQDGANQSANPQKKGVNADSAATDTTDNAAATDTGTEE